MSRVQQKWLSYLDLIEKWRQKVNITGIKTPEQMMVYILFDSLAAQKVIERLNPSSDP